MAKVTLSQLCEQHDLLSASICRMRSPERNHAWFNCGLQWADETKSHGRGIATGSGATESEALKGALGLMATIRTPDLELAA